MHRTVLPNGTASSSAASSALTSNGVTSSEDSKMREKLAALADLNELLEEPVEEQVRHFHVFFVPILSMEARKCVLLCFGYVAEFLMLIFEMTFVFHQSNQA